jgi:hypothetical protein
MSVFLYVVGALAAAAGLLALGFGIPVKEFSFGDTLIVAGTMALVGGLLLIALGAAVSQLQRIAELIGARPLARSARPLDVLVAGGAPARSADRIPFPPRPKPQAAKEPAAEEPAPAPMHVEEFAERDYEPESEAAPSLRNPDVPVMAEAEAEELPLSPVKAPAPAARSPFKFPEPPKPSFPEPLKPAAPAAETRAPSSEPPWRSGSPLRTSQSSYFDAMWKDDARGAAPAMPEPSRSSRSESIARAPAMPEPVSEPEPEQPEVEETRAVAILKSGVVDGMGYTLYVDGSIEAELPDGTLRFASINELRAHLERNS